MRLRNTIPTTLFLLLVLPSFILWGISRTASLVARQAVTSALEEAAGRKVSIAGCSIIPGKGIRVRDLGINAGNGIFISCETALFEADIKQEPLSYGPLLRNTPVTIQGLTVMSRDNKIPQALNMLGDIFSALEVTRATVSVDRLFASRGMYRISLDNTTLLVRRDPDNEISWKIVSPERISGRGILNDHAAFLIKDPALLTLQGRDPGFKQFFSGKYQVNISTDSTQTVFKLKAGPNSILPLPGFGKANYPAHTLSGNLPADNRTVTMSAVRDPAHGIILNRLRISPENKLSADYLIRDVHSLSTELTEHLPVCRIDGRLKFTAGDNQLLSYSKGMREGTVTADLLHPVSIPESRCEILRLFLKSPDPEIPKLPAVSFSNAQPTDTETPHLTVRHMTIRFNINAEKPEYTITFNQTSKLTFTGSGRIFNREDLIRIIRLVFTDKADE